MWGKVVSSHFSGLQPTGLLPAIRPVLHTLYCKPACKPAPSLATTATWLSRLTVPNSRLIYCYSSPLLPDRGIGGLLWECWVLWKGRKLSAVLPLYLQLSKRDVTKQPVEMNRDPQTWFTPSIPGGRWPSGDLCFYWVLTDPESHGWTRQQIFKELKLGEVNVTICGEYPEWRADSTNIFTSSFVFGEGSEREAAMDSAHMSSDWWGRGKKYLSLISLDDVCLGKEALRKGAEALNKSNRIMSDTTISADEGHFELAKSICMANNHIHLQLQIIQPFLPDEAGIFLWLVSIPSAAGSRIPASRPSASEQYSLLAYPTGAACCQLQMAYASQPRTWHWQHEKVTIGYSDREQQEWPRKQGVEVGDSFPWEQVRKGCVAPSCTVAFALCLLLVLVSFPH